MLVNRHGNVICQRDVIDLHRKNIISEKLPLGISGNIRICPLHYISRYGTRISEIKPSCKEATITLVDHSSGNTRQK
jgi:hypothetical protein